MNSLNKRTQAIPGTLIKKSRNIYLPNQSLVIESLEKQQNVIPIKNNNL